MPNHVLTIGLCSRDYERLEALGKTDFDEIDFSLLNDANLCELVCPCPVAFDNIVLGAGTSYRYRDNTTGEFATSNDSLLFMQQPDRWEKVPLTEEECDALRAEYGAANWYEWCSTMWGTKWGTYDTKVHQLGGDGRPLLIEFQSAWNPPIPAMMRKITQYLRANYCLDQIKWMSHDPYDGSLLLTNIADPLQAE